MPTPPQVFKRTHLRRDTTKPDIKKVCGFHRWKFLHLSWMLSQIACLAGFSLRTPPEPSPPPIKEPPDPPDNPDAPVREPDPDAPGQM